MVSHRKAVSLFPKELSMFKKISLLFVFLVMFAGLTWAANGRFTLVIDPGHGGHDAGAIGAIGHQLEYSLGFWALCRA